MAATVALLGTIETKSEELNVLSDLLRSHGLSVALVDLSLGAAGKMMSGDEKLARMAFVAERATDAIRQSDPAVVVAVGGGTGSDIALKAMRALPMDLPKILISTLPFDPRDAVADDPIVLIPTPCDIQGMNDVLRQIFVRAAAMVAGVAASDDPSVGRKPGIAVTLLGVTQAGGDAVLGLLKSHGLETYAFHAAGYGGAALSRMAVEGRFDGMIDMTVNEIVRMHVGGAHTPMPTRFTCGGSLPRIIMPGAMNFISCGPVETLSDEHRFRPHYQHSSHFSHVQLSADEMQRTAFALASDLNQSSAPCEVIVPMGGFSSEDRPGGAIESEDLRQIAADIFKAQAQSFSVTCVDHHINDPALGAMAVDRLLPHVNQERERHVR